MANASREDRHGERYHAGGCRDRSESATPSGNAATIPGTVSMRAEASWFLDQRTLPRHQVVRHIGQDLRRFLHDLIPRLEDLVAGCPDDDVPANVAQAGVAQARHRMAEPESGESPRHSVERVKRLARSVVALCDHYDALTGITMCLICDRVIDDDAWLPYERAPGGAGVLDRGRVHLRCAPAVTSHFTEPAPRPER